MIDNAIHRIIKNFIHWCKYIFRLVDHQRIQIVVILIRIEKGKNMAKDNLVYSVVANSVGSGEDVAERRLTISVNGVVIESRVYANDVYDLGEVKVKHDDVVTLSLVDVDDVGNQSDPTVYEFVAKDTIAPSSPGSVGVTLVREE